ncbi:MAG: hypothetical protein IJ583_05705 [Firmicutes bacterium]|nr:hypothetical protein [Bacillota bacterium]
MTKSVYSIVLSDDVVSAIDDMAYQMGTNRSNLINQILAERVSYITPEKRASVILKNIKENILNNDLEKVFQLLSSQGDSSIMLKSAFKYKYNPSVKYSVALNGKKVGIIGEMKLTLRTQNEMLLSKFSEFISLWVSLEKKYLSDALPLDINYSISPGRYSRELLLLKESENEETIGRDIAKYIRDFDRIMKLYFSYSGNKEIMTSDISNIIEEEYKKRLNKTLI